MEATMNMSGWELNISFGCSRPRGECRCQAIARTRWAQLRPRLVNTVPLAVLKDASRERAIAHARARDEYVRSLLALRDMARHLGNQVATNDADLKLEPFKASLSVEGVQLWKANALQT
jgi:hypothetical protein